MRTTDNVQRRRAERGVALLIAIFALLLISGVAISLIVMSGTESAIDANYRGSTQAFYAAYSGIEEGRGRLRTGAPSSIDPLTVNAGTTIMPVNQVLYILNPAGNEVVNPTNLAPDNPYRDTEYQTEFGIPVNNVVVCPSANCVPSTASDQGVPGTVFKWVRITPKTERAAGLDVDGDGDATENTRPIFYDGSLRSDGSRLNNQFLGPACPTAPCAPPPLGANGQQYGQVIRVTALAVVPGGNRRILQYDVARVVLNLSFSSALTLDGGPGVCFSGGNSNNYQITGYDSPGCGGAATLLNQPSIGTVTAPDVNNAINGNGSCTGIPGNRLGNYPGSTPSPSVVNIGPAGGGGTGTLPANQQTPASLAQLAQQIQAVATQSLIGPLGGLPNYGTQANPTITYVSGDLTLSGNPTGYGILVVTGNFVASGTVTWNGVVLVVGTGNATVQGTTTFNGAFLVANTLGGVPTYIVNGGGRPGAGTHYSSGCVSNAQDGTPYNVLSFREISQ